MKLGGKNFDNEFLGFDPLLENAKISFGYFEHFPLNPIEKPFDLMARCLFKGSAITLNGLFPGIDLMIPIVLGNGEISFLGVQVKYVREKNIVTSVQNAKTKMTFTNIFGQQSDRPFVLIILALCNSDSLVFVERTPIETKNPRDNPDVLVFKGISESVKGMIDWFTASPKGVMYRGIDESYLKECDFMHDLVKEFPYQSTTDEEDSERDHSDRFESGENKNKRQRLSTKKSDIIVGNEGAAPLNGS
jgi:hypothetical protein